MIFVRLLLLLFYLVFLQPGGCRHSRPASVTVALPPDADRQAIARRIAALTDGAEAEFGPEEVRVTLARAADSALLRRVVTAPGEAWIAETYELEEIYPHFRKVYSHLLRPSNPRPLFVLLNPSLPEGSPAPGPVAGNVRPEDMADVDSILNIPSVRSLLPEDLSLLWGPDPRRLNRFLPSIPVQLVAVRGGSKLKLHPGTVEQTWVSQNEGEMSESAYIVFHPKYSKHWLHITSSNTGRSLAIVIDGRVSIWFSLSEQIEDGSLSITGPDPHGEYRFASAVISGGPLYSR